ncbi:hypothetical protein [Streptomyces clavuligerus]|uniref:Uncharacterized protein n=1 Tax=Streptomyces clavuligerus TaxID=1901 RepID=B5GMB1_STRCL|nr:hypothetical protein [Streptomyces clavuligerus]ANW22338.1 hypothetical protein BB341_28840 [Streptomyces clavuligerus]AXU17238.1 hypothetical protein D1794_31935 [Streptomyces clavuligerus]EDY47457.1 hypothetical protein SSCG_00485 [Streptomyces clavuligerus]EFG04421.1 Hypothetical protein SCLAV_p0934 [Streptomyces clavuligerus]MBY6307117.1 hypothetical protein [Streptomyces clavuligerus]
MAGHPEPHRITVGGHEAVALTVRGYEQLLANRRQIGGQSARIRVLSQEIRKSRLLLRELEALVEEAVCDCPRQDGEQVLCPTVRPAEPTDRKGEECLRGALASLIRHHQEGAV